MISWESEVSLRILNNLVPEEILSLLFYHKISMDSRSFFLFPNMTSLTRYFILHMSGSPGRYGNQVYQLGGLLFMEAFISS